MPPVGVAKAMRAPAVQRENTQDQRRLRRPLHPMVL
jgi:hypothetical protein